jgi:hypothetical protein
MANGCKAPDPGEAFPLASSKVSRDPIVEAENDISDVRNDKAKVAFPITGNVVIKRVVDDPSESNGNAPSGSSSASAFRYKVPVKHQRVIHNALNPSTSSSISNLFNREHAPGIRQAGCPCCDPENLSNVVDTMMML